MGCARRDMGAIGFLDLDALAPSRLDELPHDGRDVANGPVSFGWLTLKEAEPYTREAERKRIKVSHFTSRTGVHLA